MSSDTLALRGTKAEALSESVIRQVFGGRLFTDDFLAKRLIRLANSESVYGIDDDEVNRLYDEAKAIFTDISLEKHKEAGLLNKVILPIMKNIGWEHYSHEAFINYGKGLNHGRIDVAFFDNEKEYKSADPNSLIESASLILEAKGPQVALDTSDGKISVPATQILGYLNRAAILSSNKIQWGILTNGAEWRLYYQKAQSMAEQFFAVRLDRLFSDKILPTKTKKNKDYDEEDEKDSVLNKLACFKIFLLIFGKQAFQSTPPTNYNFHQLALNEVKFYQQQITDSLTDEIFDEIYEKFALAIAEQAKDATSEEVKQATLKILYRILFILYAEDRDLLPTGEQEEYRHYSLKTIRRRFKREGIPSANSIPSLWWSIKNLCKIINEGNSGLGVPKYNGGLFKDDDIPLLSKIEIPDSIMGKTLYSLSYHGADYINYRNLNVEQLGSVYENLLEREIKIIEESGKLKISESNYTRKRTGSYYTPEELVSLVIKEATDPAYQKYINDFENEALALIDDEDKNDLEKGKALTEADAATAILNQKICDPAMGSGHFLVNLTDSLTDQVIKAMGETKSMAPKEWEYQSPLRYRIDEISDTIRGNAKKNGHKLNEEHLQDRHIIRRIVLKSCVYGVDKNPTAVELAKLSLWLHTFTVGAPLSFLDHHLKCGDSLFGLETDNALLPARGGLMINEKMQTILKQAVVGMQKIAYLTDSEISQVEKSEAKYKDVQELTKSLKKVLSFIHAGDWLSELATNEKQKKANEEIVNNLLDGKFGDYFDVIGDPKKNLSTKPEHQQAIDLIKEIEKLSKEEHFFHWEVEFPEVWRFQNGGMKGGFDAVIGNPPWDKIRLDDTEWFADRDKIIANAPNQAAHKAEIEKLKERNPLLYEKYIKTKQLTKARLHVCQNAGIYQELNKGDIDIYRLFVERSRQLVSSDGLASFLVPSAIASDKASALFFKNLVKNKQIKSFYDFRNGDAKYKDSESGEYKSKYFFKRVATNAKFCVLTHAKHEIPEKPRYACFIQSIDDITDPEKYFFIDSKDFNFVNPNTGTLPIFRNLHDKELITEIYRNHPILKSDNISNRAKDSAWQMKYEAMLHASGDSELFATKDILEKENCYSIGDNRYKNNEEIWLPIYKGTMFSLHDHRYATIIVNPDNRQRQQQPVYTDSEQHKDPHYLPLPNYWIKENERTNMLKQDWVLAFRDVTGSANKRTFVTAILPRAAYDHTAPILINEGHDKNEYLLYANFSAIPFDYIARNKTHGTHMSWYIVKQLPVIDVDIYDIHKFGNKTAEQVIREIILELAYTATDLRGFAKNLDYVDDKGEAKPPFKWDEYRRLSLCAKLDAIYFILYGISKADNIKYIYSTFSNLDYQAKRLELCLKYKNALLNGECDIFYEVLG